MNLLTQAELARALGVARSTIHKWKSTRGLEFDAQGLIDLDHARRLIDAGESPAPHHQARKAQFDEQRETGNGKRETPNTTTHAVEPMPAMEKLGAALKLETYKLQKARAETANVELDKLSGALVERAEIEYVLADFGSTLRGLLEVLPDRLAGALAAHRGDANAIHKSLEDTAHDLLTEMSEHMKRKMETA